MAKTYKVIIPPSARGMRLSTYLAENGYPINAACGGMGICNKCLVTLEKGQLFSSPTPDATPLVPDENGQVRACRAFCGEKETHICLIANERTKEKVTTTVPQSQSYGVALDIGTTTLAASLVALPSGTVLDTCTELDPLATFGADVVSRIHACQNGHLSAMQNTLLAAVRDMLSYFKHKLPKNAHLSALACVGNTTMLHLFWGISPCGMAAYPFTPAFTDMKTADGGALSLDVDTVYTLPSATAFFGADAISGIVHTELCDSPLPTLLIDLGTNGELALYTGKEDDRLFVTSTAAGPAFEGAGISTGVGGVEGAVCRVAPRGQSAFSIETVGGVSPIGICGAALIDIVYALRLQGRLDETGYLRDGSVVYAQGERGALSITQEDIRAFQVAKSAIRAGIDALLSAADLPFSALDTILLGGGMGQYLHIKEAQSIGLLPNACKRIQSVQNCALGGAVAFLRGGCDASPYRESAKRALHIELNDSPIFSSAFMAHMRLDRS